MSGRNRKKKIKQYTGSGTVRIKKKSNVPTFYLINEAYLIYCTRPYTLRVVRDRVVYLYKTVLTIRFFFSIFFTIFLLFFSRYLYTYTPML